MKLIHTADLHLGARTEAKLDPQKATKRREELLATFARIAALAEQEGAAVLIAGDLFDTATPSERTLNAVLDTVRHYATVPFLCLPGNHDGGRFPASHLPENLTVFGESWSSVSLGDTDVYGISPQGEIPYDELRPDPARRNVVLLHGAVREGGTAEPGSILLSRLQGKGIDYLALGHYHSVRVEALDGRGVWAYSGTPEGRGMDEEGECGVLVVDTALSPMAPCFFPIATRRIHRIPVDISDTAGSVFAITEAIERALTEVRHEDLVRVELVGKLPPPPACPRPDSLRLLEQFEGRYFYFEIKDRTRLAIDPDDYRDSLNLKGEFVRRVMAADLTPEERDAVLRAGFAALSGEGDEI